MKKTIIIAFVIGLLLRLVLAITTYHSDLGAFALAGHYIVNQGKVFSFYDMTRQENETVFNYQPLAYLYPALIYSPWANLVNSTYKDIQNNEISQLKLNTVYWPLLVYKLPMILADMAIFFLIPLFFRKEKNKQLAQLLWWFNPLGIYVGSMMGQVDVVMAALLVTGYYFFQKNKLGWCAISIALSALFKPIGLILLPLLWIEKKDLKATIVGYLVYLLGIIPYLGSVSYRYYALAAEQISKTTYAGIAIASGTVIPWFFIMLAIAAVALWHKKISFLEAMTAMILSSLAFSHFHPQWLVWITPLLLIWVIKQKQLVYWPMMIFCWLLVLLSFDPTLHSQIFLASHWNLLLPKQADNVILLGRAGLVVLVLVLLRFWGPSERS
ncbi:hypothetical protein M1116_00860 [Patescibacteria group bacterium]|nr:hypothetical protein [Patescibacteria group bacterium]